MLFLLEVVVVVRRLRVGMRLAAREVRLRRILRGIWLLASTVLVV
jgi:hypothetical protein